MNEHTDNFDSYCLRAESTDVGRRRKANEDSCRTGITQNGLVSLVCDGMGGHVGGATASRIAVDTIFNVLENRYFEDPREAITVSINTANQAILDHAAAHPELTGMGSTCVMLLVRDGLVYIGHVGDSRIYLIRNFKPLRLTKDHSFVQMLVDMGEITQEQAEHHERRNEITNALGIPGMQPATVREDAIEPQAGDCFVLCSDGLSGMISDEEMAKVAGQHSMHIQQRADTLVAKANEAGGVDNITVELVEFAASPADKDTKSAGGFNTRRNYIWLCIGVIAIVAIVLLLSLRSCNNGDTPEITVIEGEVTQDPGADSPEGSETGEQPISGHVFDLGTVVYEGKAPFLTITGKGKLITLSFSSAEKMCEHNIPGTLSSDMKDLLIADNSLVAAMTQNNGEPSVSVKYIGNAAPKTSFSIILKNEAQRDTINFMLVPKVQPSSQPQPRSQLQPGATRPEISKPEPSAPKEKVPQGEEDPMTPSTGDDGNGEDPDRPHYNA